MLIRAKAPLRISFAGGGTDIYSYFQKEGGCVINATINKYAYGSLRPTENNQINIKSLDFDMFLNCKIDEELIYDGKLDLIKAAIKKFEGNKSKGFNLFLHSDAPPGSGLGSSSAMMVTLVGLLNIEINKNILRDNDLIKKIALTFQKIIKAYKSNKKVILFGNGGSAADAQHLTAELVNKFYLDRKSLPAEALTVNTSILTAIGNDYYFNQIFSKQLEGIGAEGDIAIGISTSGNSKNIIEGLKFAKEKKLYTIDFTGKNGGKINNIVDVCINVPSDDTPRIQEAYIMIGHIICEIVEKELFKKNEKEI